jgi:hypothetical protein
VTGIQVKKQKFSVLLAIESVASFHRQIHPISGNKRKKIRQLMNLKNKGESSRYMDIELINSSTALAVFFYQNTPTNVWYCHAILLVYEKTKGQAVIFSPAVLDSKYYQG